MHGFTRFSRNTAAAQGRAWNLAQSLGHGRCFYTDLDCLFPIKNSVLALPPLRATIEHLNPRSKGGAAGSANQVLAANFINSLVGNAPVEIKLALRDHLADQPRLGNENALIASLKSATLAFLSPYKFSGTNTYLWQPECLPLDDPRRVA
jgi:hypothetical protein